MKVTRLAGGLSVLVLVSAMGSTALAGPTPAQKCASTKIKAVGKKAACLLKLYGKQEATAAPADTAKLQKCKDKLSHPSDGKGAFEKADGKGGCAITGDGGGIESKVDMFVDQVTTALLVSPPNPCDGAKLKSAGKKAKCLLGLKAKEAAGGGLDQTKVQKCKDKLSADYAKAETKPPCLTSSDAGAVEQLVDDFVDDVFAEIPSVPFPPCTCGGSATNLTFTTGAGSGNCGTATKGDGSTFVNLACSGLYFGGGSSGFPLPVTEPDMTTARLDVRSCVGTTLTLAGATALETGSNKTCTKAACLFGAPLPMPNPVSPPVSYCVISQLAADATGMADCAAGNVQMSLPLSWELYLTGDLLHLRCSGGSNAGARCTTPGADPLCLGGGTCVADSATNQIQPCPICNTSDLKCAGGPNDGLACTPGTSALGAAYPTSHDCPPPPGNDVGRLLATYALTTGMVSRTAVPSGTQQRVFCGFCRDADFSAGGGFENPAHACHSNTDCTQPFESCEQRSNGAFGPNGGLVQTITESGLPAGDLSDLTSHPVTLVSTFCVPPFFNAFLDGANDLPGPGAVALPGQAQLLP